MEDFQALQSGDAKADTVHTVHTTIPLCMIFS